ncbi:MAG: molecular chaperone DnaK, partial [Tetrasphaera sp.]|nr:molecular chaperone DnaK [Tetrasphaera sp.]
LTDDLRKPVDEALADLKEAIKPESTASVEDINAKVTKLNEESQKMGAALYAASAEQGESPNMGGGESTDSAQGTTPADDSDVVDAEVVEDDEDDKK